MDYSDNKSREIFAERLTKLMRDRGINQSDISRILGVSTSTVSSWCLGARMPRMDKIEALANRFFVPKSYFIEDSEGVVQYPRVPVLGDVAAGIPMYVEENIIDYEEISFAVASQGEHFCLRVCGDSMEPKFSDGDVVIVRKQSDVDTGDIAVVLVNGDRATVKKIKKRPDGVMLVPLNSAFEPMFYNTSEVEELPVVILGRVVELRAKF